ncbi:right-handed parallel beta-helix repeat-containing protein [Algoriphagus taiwanensis]|uniref:right-handed parallel beta-helix repeat-containing protein n=1 Tax=Algoriphagus taiwanensis TaxID=1445656 RepID=UPI0030C69341
MPLFRFFPVFFSLLFFSLNTYPQTINLAESGGDPSGQKDNSKLINQIVDSLSSVGGGTIFIPKGKYLLDDGVILKSNVILKGESKESVILFRNPDTGNWKTTKSQGLISTLPNLSNTNILVESLTINGNFERKSSGAKGGICLRNCSKSKIRDVITQNTWHGVAFYDFKGENSENSIEEVKSENAHAFTSKDNSGRPRGILVMDPGARIIQSQSIGAGTGFYAHGRNITLIGNHAENWFEDNGYYLIVDQLTVRDCSAKGGPSPEKGFGSGFAIAYRKGALIENCTAINCSNYGFRIHVPQSDTQLINNQAVGCGNGFGVEVASHPFPEVSNNLLFKDNKAEKSGLHGFLFRQMTNSQVVGNKAINGNQRGVTLSTRGAIALKEHLSDNTFDDNECIDNQSKKTQTYGLYDFSVSQITSDAKKGKNNKIKHRSKSGIDEF